METKTFTHKVSTTTLDITIEPAAKKGLTNILINGTKIMNFRTTDKGYRTGRNLMIDSGSIPEDHRKKHGMIEVSGVAYYPLTMTPEAVAKATADLLYGPKVERAEAKAKAKAEAEAKAKAKAEAETKVTETKPKPKARTRKVTTKAEAVAK
jgi:hypothetical protein